MNNLAPFAREYHQRAGDYLERATGYARQGIRPPFQVTRVVMTDEESYTCEYCDRKFENHRRLAAARRQGPRERGEAGRCGGDGPVPEEGLAGPLLPAESDVGTTGPAPGEFVPTKANIPIRHRSCAAAEGPNAGEPRLPSPRPRSHLGPNENWHPVT